MNKVGPNQGDKAPVSGRIIPRFSLLLTLLLTLLAVAGCRPGSNQPTATADEQPTSSVAAEPTQRATTTDSVAALGQPASQEPPSQYLRFSRLTAEDGLPNDQVWDVVQDNDGFMWFATVDGLI